MNHFRGFNYSNECTMMLNDRNRYTHSDRIKYIRTFHTGLYRDNGAQVRSFIINTLEWNPTVELLTLLWGSTLYDTEILHEHIFPLTIANLSSVMHRLKNVYGSSRDDKIIHYINQHIVMTQEIVNIMINFTHKQFGELIASYMMKNDVPITNEFMNACCSNQPYMWPVLDYVISNGYNFTPQQFISIPDVNIMKKVLEIKSFDINEKLFLAFLDTRQICPEHISRILHTNLRSHPTLLFQGQTHTVTSYSDEKFELFVSLGLKITQDSLVKGIEKHITFPNIDRFDIKMDKDALLKKCTESKYYPQYTSLGISNELIELKNIVHTNCVGLKTFYKKNPTVVPDKEIMKNIGSKDIKPMFINTLIEKGGVVTFETMENSHVKRYETLMPHFKKSCKQLIQDQINVLNNVKNIKGVDSKMIDDQINNLKNYFNVKT